MDQYLLTFVQRPQPLVLLASPVVQVFVLFVARLPPLVLGLKPLTKHDSRVPAQSQPLDLAVLDGALFGVPGHGLAQCIVLGLKLRHALCERAAVNLMHQDSPQEVYCAWLPCGRGPSGGLLRRLPVIWSSL